MVARFWLQGGCCGADVRNAGADGCLVALVSCGGSRIGNGICAGGGLPRVYLVRRELFRRHREPSFLRDMAHRVGRCAPGAFLLGVACAEPRLRAEHPRVSSVRGRGLGGARGARIDARTSRLRVEARRALHVVRAVHALYRRHGDRDPHVLVGDVRRDAVRAHRLAYCVLPARR